MGNLVRKAFRLGTKVKRVEMLFIQSRTVYGTHWSNDKMKSKWVKAILALICVISSIIVKDALRTHEKLKNLCATVSLGGFANGYAREMGKKGRERIFRECDLKIILEQMEKIYKEALRLCPQKGD